MANYGRGWGSGYGGQSYEDMCRHWDKEALEEGDWGWLDKSPTYGKETEEEQG